MAEWGNDNTDPSAKPSDENVPVSSEAVLDPQSKGWGQRVTLDYESLKDDKAVDSTYWGHARLKYDYIPEEGELIGPRSEELERDLFNTEHKVTVGNYIEHIQNINVEVAGPENVRPIKKFDDAGLHPIVLESIRMSNYVQPTPVQQYTIPAVLKGCDVVAIAQTGSGKTAAYMVPVLSKLMGKVAKLAKPRPQPISYNPQTDAICAEPLVLVICPTRELALQIFDEARRLCYRSMLRPSIAYGGGPREMQLDDIKRGCDILIGTPGRLKDFLETSSRWVSLRRVQYTILDEADEMLKSDWETEMSSMLAGGAAQSDGNHQFLMFSATFPKEAREMARKFLQDDYLFIKVGRIGSAHQNIIQDVIWVNNELKEKALVDLILSEAPCRTLVFTNSTNKADMLDDLLYNCQMPVTCIHAKLSQREREDSIRNFRSGKCPILVASAITARGLDVKNVMHIINYDLPSADHGGITEYVHRIGRTARLGNLGKATSFYNDCNADIAVPLVKTLMETKQKIPEFLEEFKPETVTWEEDESDDEADPTTDQGANNASSGGWGASGEDDASKSGNDGWGAATTSSAW